MVMRLEQVTPLGRSLEEYWLMFALTEKDLDKKIVGVGDGPASFNAEMKELGNNVTSVDPLYEFTGEEIEKQFYAVIDKVIEQVKSSPGNWVWAYHTSPEHLKLHRKQAIIKFLKDYEQGKAEGRYVSGELPKLDFKDDAFDLALCSHFLFLYSKHFDYEFHRESVYEMLRIAEEVRIFPLLDLMLDTSVHIEPLTKELRGDGYSVEIKQVQYEMQRGGNKLMIITRQDSLD